MATEKNIPNLIINKVENQDVFDYLVSDGQVNENELYLIPGEAGGGVQDVMVYSSNDQEYVSVVDSTDNKAYLREAASKNVDTEVSARSINLPTSEAVANYVYEQTVGKVNIASQNLSGMTTTLLAETKTLAEQETPIQYERWICKYDGASSGISDKPTGNTDAGFVCEVYMDRWVSTTDYRYILICWVKDTTYPYIAIVNYNTSSLSWKQLIDNSSSQALTNKTYNGYTLAAACAKGVVTSVDTSANLPTSNAVKTFVEGKGYVTTDTKNTAGSTDTSSKIYLVGATSQAANPQTYSDNEVYATSGVLTTKSVQVGGTAATMQYNSTDKCIEFVFA